MEYVTATKGKSLDIEKAYKLIDNLIDKQELSRVLLVPPDITRKSSQAGPLTVYAYKALDKKGVHVDVIPALGSHKPMTKTEFETMFPGIPYSKMMVHDWRNDTIDIGEVPEDFVYKISNGKLSYKIPLQVNKVLYDNYDLIISLGQVVPHEVVGMANYSKNIFVGLGGREMIDKTHFLSAVYGIEQTLGQIDTPVRAVFDYGHEKFMKDLPLVFLLTVVGDNGLVGVFISENRNGFEAAAQLSTKENIKYIDPVDVAVCYMDPQEYKTTWLANKAIYRTRCAIKDGGTLYVLAPGVKAFGEDIGIDKLIRRYGYIDHKSVLEAVDNDADVGNALSMVAHLIHGSADGRFKVVYCTNDISAEEIKKVNYDYMSYVEAKEIFKDLTTGVNIINGKRVLYTEHAALELWRSL